MKVHHLNCGTMRFPTALLISHVLLVETNDRLVLVDAGFGTRDIAQPQRLGPSRHLVRPALNESETALHQIRALGFDSEDVRDILLTHLDIDHVGGISDFPNARIHLTDAEARSAVHSPSVKAKNRYQSQQWSHRPELVEHSAEGEGWCGFAAARELSEIGEGIVLIPLPGHTLGHAAYAVKDGAGWILHAGDSFYHYSILDGNNQAPLALKAFESLVAFDRRQVRQNHEKLAHLHSERSDFRIVNSHDPVLLARSVEKR